MVGSSVSIRKMALPLFQDSARHGRVGRGSVGHGMAWLGTARQGEALDRNYYPRLGMARSGMAW